jgi:hypothetical protein
LGKQSIVQPIRLSSDAVAASVPAGERIRELEHLLELERARRAAIEEGLDRLSVRCGELARENAALRDMLPADAALPEAAV